MRLLSPSVYFPISGIDIPMETARYYRGKLPSLLKPLPRHERAECVRLNALDDISKLNFQEGIAALESIKPGDLPLLDFSLHKMCISTCYVVAALANNDSVEAINKLRSLLEQIRDYEDKSNIDFQAIFASTMYHLAYLRNMREEYDLAEKDLQFAQKLFKKLEKYDQSRFGESLIVAVAASTEVFHSRIKVAHILAQYHATTVSLTSRIRMNPDILKEYIDSVQRQADILLSVGNFKESVKYYSRALELLKKVPNHDKEKYLELSFGLAKGLIHLPRRREQGYALLEQLQQSAEDRHSMKQLNEINTLKTNRTPLDILDRLRRIIKV